MLYTQSFPNVYRSSFGINLICLLTFIWLMRFLNYPYDDSIRARDEPIFTSGQFLNCRLSIRKKTYFVLCNILPNSLNSCDLQLLLLSMKLLGLAELGSSRIGVCNLCFVFNNNFRNGNTR